MIEVFFYALALIALSVLFDIRIALRRIADALERKRV